jgi:RNA polymerase sigma-70 factor (ECF subfamily)
MRDEAYERAVRMHKDRVHTYATWILRDRAEAQDVAQEALVRLWEHRRGVDGQGVRRWLMRTVHNLCIDQLRRRKTRSEVDDGEAVMNHRPDMAPGPEKGAESSQLRDTIEQALAALSSKDRAVVVMREVQGMPYDEIATALDLPLGTLKARLHRARERLRSKLARAGVTP